MPKEITQVNTVELKNLIPEFEEIMFKNLNNNVWETLQITKEWLLSKKFSPAKSRLIFALLTHCITNQNLKNLMEKINTIRVYNNNEIVIVPKKGKEERMKVNLAIFENLNI